MSAYGTIYGLIVLIMIWATAGASIFFGVMYDQFASYNYAILGAALAFALGAVSYLLVGRYPTEPGLKI
jgi:hypothetical protein